MNSYDICHIVLFTMLEDLIFSWVFPFPDQIEKKLSLSIEEDIFL